MHTTLRSGVATRNRAQKQSRRILRRACERVVQTARFGLESLESRQLLSLPAGWNSQDIGTATDPQPAVSASESGGIYTVIGAGSDIWNNADQFHFAYTQLSGDGTIIADISSMTKPATNEWA
jgi:hypothetical protein